MNKQQLIESYNEMVLSLNTPVELTEKVIPLWSYLWGIVGLLILLWFVISVIVHKKRDPLGEVTFSAVFFFCLLPVGLALMLTLMNYSDANKPVSLTDAEKAGIRGNWEKSILQKEYLDNLPREKYEAVDYMPSSEEGVTVIVKSDKALSLVSGIKTVRFTTDDSMYVESSWVEGLSEIGYPDHYYNSILYMSDKHKTN